MFHSLLERYRDLGFPVNLVDPSIEFTIFNLKDVLKELPKPLPFAAQPARLNFFVFSFVKQAQGWYKIDNQQFEIKPYTVYFINPGHYRSFENTALEEFYLITLSEGFLKENVHPNIFEEFPFLLVETMPACTISPAQFAEFERLYLQIEHEYRSRSPFRKRLIGHLFVALLLKFKEHFWLDYNPLDEGSRHSKIVQSFKLLMEKHYRDLSNGLVEQAFRVQEYAEALHLQPTYLSNVIKSKTGKPVGFWIAEKTVAEAKALLQHSDLPIKEIAYRLGFAEPAHFSNYFKKHTRETPVLYRHRNQPVATTDKK